LYPLVREVLRASREARRDGEEMVCQMRPTISREEAAMHVHARRTIPLSVSLSLLAAAATLVAGASLAAAAPNAPIPMQPKVLDVGQVRLHVPVGWTVTVAEKICGHGTCRRQCAPGYEARVYVSTFAPLLRCPLNFRRNSVWVVPTSQKGATTRQTSTYDGTTEILTIPSSGVALYGFGKLGVRAVDSEEPSTLARLLAAHLPVAVPSGWHAITDGVLSVEVPRTWPTHFLAGPNAINPGSCGAPYFPRPTAVVGSGTAIVFCPFVTPSVRAQSLATPGNGAWLVGSKYVAPGTRKPGPFRLFVEFSPPGTATRSRAINGLVATFTYGLAPNGTNAVLATVTVGGHSHDLVLGLGLTPLIAEEILSSLRVA
jgi:hypothetical protein